LSKTEAFLKFSEHNQMAARNQTPEAVFFGNTHEIPFSPMTSTQRTTLRVQGWRVDPWLDEMSRDGQVVKLEPRTMRTLIYLAERAGEVVSIETLLDEVWSGVVVTHDSVYQAIATLRRALGEGVDGSSYIINVPRRGYRLVASVGPWDESTPQSTSLPVPPASLKRGRFNRTAWIAGVAAVVLIAAFCLAVWFRSMSARTTTAKIALPVSLAVLPFDDLSEKSDRQYLAEGMTEELIDALSRLPSFRVVGRASSFRFPNHHSDDLTQLGQELGAAYFLTGSIRTQGQRLRVAVKINAASDGRQLWSQSLEGPIEDALRMEDDITKNVSGT
jgi:transcriptional activator of cad operon